MSSVIGRPLAALLGIVGQAGSGELDAQPTPHGPDRPPPSWSAWPWSRPSPCSAPRCRKSATGSVDQAISADYIVTSSAQRGRRRLSATRWPPRRPDPRGDGRHPPSTAASSSCGDSVATLTAVSPPTHLSRHHQSCGWTSGTGAPALAAGQLLIDTTTANAKHLSVGRRVPVKFAQTGTSTMRIGGIFKPNALLGSYLVGRRLLPRPLRQPAARGRLMPATAAPGLRTTSRSQAASPPIRT